MDEATEKVRAEFDAIPDDRVYAILKLCITDDGEPGGAMMFYGNKLKDMGVSKATAIECGLIAKMVGQAAQQAVDRAGLLSEVLGPIAVILDHTHDAEGNCQTEDSDEFVPDEVIGQ